MANNADLNLAQQQKHDEFYTQYQDIEAEINAYIEYNPDVFRNKTVLLPCDDPEWSNFTRYCVANFRSFGLKRLISTSYAKGAGNKHPTDFETTSSAYDVTKHATHGKLFVLDRDTLHTDPIGTDALSFTYLEGDGDFRSDEVKKLRNEADIIVTNPPFSLFRAFVSWLYEANKQFIIIGNSNAITYKEIFPLIQSNQLWLGASIHSGDRKFGVPDTYPLDAAGCGIDEKGQRYIRVKGVRWFTNIDHGVRHEKYIGMSTADNLKFNKKLVKKLKEYGVNKYPRYDDYDAIEIPFSNAIPTDYFGIMGVPITFLDKFNPDEFTIIGLDRYTVPKQFLVGGRVAINGKPTYARILIRRHNASPSHENT